MKIIHHKGFSEQERALHRSTIYKNLLECAKSIVGAYMQFSLEPSSAKVQEFAEFLWTYTIDPDPQKPLDPKVGDAMVYVWNDPCTSTVLEHQTEFYLMDSAP